MRTVQAPASARALDPLQVLCVDDDTASLAALNELLQQWGMRVTMRHALANDDDDVAPADTFDMAIIDNNLGPNRPSGLDIITQLVEAYELPCVLITADRDKAVRERARALGVAILYKPIAPAKLRAVLSHIQTQIPA